MSDPGVRYVQGRLAALGFDPGGCDGIWGENTRKALDAALPLATAGVDPELVAAVKRDEGCSTTAYPDPLSPLGRIATTRGVPWSAVPNWRELSGGPWTIGYGHTGADVAPGVAWPLERCEAVLLADLQAHNETLMRVIPWIAGLDPVRRRVLQNMHFNLGWDNPRTPALEGLAGFTRTLAKVRAGDYAGAAEGMAASLWARQVKSRAERLCREMRTGVASA